MTEQQTARVLTEEELARAAERLGPQRQALLDEKKAREEAEAQKRAQERKQARQAGIAWAVDKATWAHLRRVKETNVFDRFRCPTGEKRPPFRQEFYAFLVDSEKKTTAKEAEQFWRELLGEDWDKSNCSSFARDFIDGALEVYKLVSYRLEGRFARPKLQIANIDAITKTREQRELSRHLGTAGE
jgi:hypothetical protein